MRTSNSRKLILVGSAAALVLLGGGVLYITLNRPEPTAAAPVAEDEHAEGEEEHAEGEEAPAEEGAAEGEHADEEGEVHLTAAQITAAGIQVVGVDSGGGGAETRLSGRVEPTVGARAAAAASVGGRVERILVSPGQSVRAGQALATVVSGEAASFRADSEAAQAQVEALRQAHQRNQNLADQGVVARQEVEASRALLLSAEAAARAAQARASAAGAPDASGRFNVSSPIAGVVTNIQGAPGGFLAQGGVVAEVTNPSAVEVVFQAPPALAASVRAGSALRATGPAGQFDAIVTGVAAGAGLDSGGTVIRARPRSGSLPPIGTPVIGAVITGGTAGTMTVPSDAVQTVEGASVVFVRNDEGFLATPVLTGRTAAGRTEILNGLTGSERIAGTNAFLLKAELAKGEAEHGH